MLTMTIQTDVEKTIRQLGVAQRQIAFAAALALTKTAQQAQRDVTAELPKVFDRPTPFTMRAIAMERANKQTLTARVYIRPIQAEYLRREIAGGTALPKKRALVIPFHAELNQYGGLPRTAVKRLLRRKDTFSGTVRGVSGIWQRTGKTVRLLVAYEGKAEYKPRFPFAALVMRSVERNLPREMHAAIRRAVATAR